MVCTGCGAEANASCNCGMNYVPAAKRAAEAIAANPEKSDRAIAAEIGVSPMTVNRARKDSGVTNDTPEKERTGQDGKKYPATKPKRHRGARMSEFTDEPQHERGAQLHGVRGAPAQRRCAASSTWGVWGVCCTNGL